MPETPSIQSLARMVLFSPMQRQKIETSIAHNEYLLNSPEMRGAIHVAPDTELLTFNIERDRAMLQSGTAPEYDPATKNKLFALGNAIVDRLKSDEDFLTHDEMERPLQHNVTRLRRWEQRNKQHFLALKTIRRILDGANDDPDFTSIVQFRKDTPPLGNPRKYWTGFDNVEWTKNVEEQLAEEIPEDLYARFLELKVLDWAKLTIMKELEMSPVVFDACQARFARMRQGLRERGAANLAQDDFVPAPTKPQDRSKTPAAVAARAVGMPLIPVREDKPRHWPMSELTSIGVTVDDLVSLVEIPQGMLYKKAREKRFTKKEITTIKDALESLKVRRGVPMLQVTEEKEEVGV